MRRWGWFFGCVLMLPQMQPANGQTPSADEIVTQVMKHDADRRAAAGHVDAVGRASSALTRNVREDLLVESLMVELSGLLE